MLRVEAVDWRRAGASRRAPELLDQAERARLARFRTESDRRRFAAAHVRLRELVAGACGADPAELRFGNADCPACGARERGRPVLESPADSGVEFSISYSGAVVLIGVSDEGPVGVDVERFPSLATVSAVLELLGSDEREQVLSAPLRERPGAFARVWTRREAWLKGLGVGLGHGLEWAPQPDDGWTIEEVPVAAGHAAAVATLLRLPPATGEMLNSAGTTVIQRASTTA